jgi:hypothetical protein
MVETKLTALDPLRQKLEQAGISNLKLERLVAAADPQNLAIAKSEFSRVLQEDDICEYPLSVTMQIIQEVLEVDSEADPETEGLINYLVLLLEHYLNRRRNVFTITGKDEENAGEVAEFDKQYFGLDEMTQLKEN